MSHATVCHPFHSQARCFPGHARCFVFPRPLVCVVSASVCLRRIVEMDQVGAQLSQLEHARALAAVQQEAQRIASTLDQTLTLQQANAAAKVAEQQAEARALQQVRSTCIQWHALHNSRTRSMHASCNLQGATTMRLPVCFDCGLTGATVGHHSGVCTSRAETRVPRAAQGHRCHLRTDCQVKPRSPCRGTRGMGTCTHMPDSACSRQGQTSRR